MDETDGVEGTQVGVGDPGDNGNDNEQGTACGIGWRPWRQRQ